MNSVVRVHNVEQRITGARDSEEHPLTHVLCCPYPCLAHIVPRGVGFTRCPDCNAALVVRDTDIAWWYAKP